MTLSVNARNLQTLIEHLESHSSTLCDRKSQSVNSTPREIAYLKALVNIEFTDINEAVTSEGKKIWIEEKYEWDSLRLEATIGRAAKGSTMALKELYQLKDELYVARNHNNFKNAEQEKLDELRKHERLANNDKSYLDGIDEQLENTKSYGYEKLHHILTLIEAKHRVEEIIASCVQAGKQISFDQLKQHLSNIIGELKSIDRTLQDMDFGGEEALLGGYVKQTEKCKTKLQAERANPPVAVDAQPTYWSRFKTEFKRNTALRLGIYFLAGVAFALATVATAGIATGIGVGAALATMGTFSAAATVNAGTIFLGVTITAALSVFLSYVATGIKKCFSPAPVQTARRAPDAATPPPASRKQLSSTAVSSQQMPAQNAGKKVQETKEATSEASASVKDNAPATTYVVYGIFNAFSGVVVPTRIALHRQPQNQNDSHKRNDTITL